MRVLKQAPVLILRRTNVIRTVVFITLRLEIIPIRALTMLAKQIKLILSYE